MSTVKARLIKLETARAAAEPLRIIVDWGDRLTVDGVEVETSREELQRLYPDDNWLIITYDPATKTEETAWNGQTVIRLRDVSINEL